jgi:hypothetical protein
MHGLSYQAMAKQQPRFRIAEPGLRDDRYVAAI